MHVCTLKNKNHGCYFLHVYFSVRLNSLPLKHHHVYIELHHSRGQMAPLEATTTIINNEVGYLIEFVFERLSKHKSNKPVFPM